MVFENNFSITNLFIEKYITVAVNNQQTFKIHTPTIREFNLNPGYAQAYRLWIMSIKELQKFYIVPINNHFEALCIMIFNLGMYDHYRTIANNMMDTLKFILPNVNIDMSQKTISVNGLTLTDEIWEYILYIIKLSCGEKVNQPLTFDSEEMRQRYLAQQEMEERINKIKRNSGGDKEALGKSFLAITYAFPSITIDYLCDQTMAQIQWLQKYAAGAMSYEVNAKAMAAGNMKKGSKLDFFIK